MSIIERILNHSNTYKDYKYRYLELESNVSKLEKKIEKLEKQNDSTNKLFNSIFLDYELKPRPINQGFQDLSVEFLKFVDNVCNKYDIEWMIEGGTVLGAVRHDGFIPWDDDIDAGMMREDYNKFIAIIYDELEKNGLNNVVPHFHNKTMFKGKHVGRFFQLFYFDETKIGRSLTAIDFFPYDFKKELNPDTYSSEFRKARKKFYKDIINDVDIETLYERYYENLGLSYEKQPYIIQGVDGTQSLRGKVKIQGFETDEMLPFKRINFNGTMLPCANNPDYYLKKIYGNYRKIPKTVELHKRMKRLRKTPNMLEILNRNIDKLKEINENFE